MSFNDQTAEQLKYKIALEGATQFREELTKAAGGFDIIKAKAVEADAVLAKTSVAKAGAAGLSPADAALWASMNAKGAAAARASTLPELAAASSLGRVGALGGAAGLARLGLGVGAAGAGFAVLQQAKAAIGVYGEQQRLEMQVGAAIKSTGGAANVTQEQVGKLADKLAFLAGAEDNAVVKAESLLLGFDAIRNTGGGAHAVFDRTSLAVQNMAARMGTDGASAAMMLGRALQDPIKNVATLRQTGVSFTDQQIDMIKVLQASGDKFGAQNLILQQVERQFGGAAKAAGDTLPGSFQRLNNSYEASRQKLLSSLFPVLTDLNNWLAIKIPEAALATEQAIDKIEGVPGIDISGKDLWDKVPDVLKRSGKDTVGDFFGGSDTKPMGTIAGRFGLVPGTTPLAEPIQKFDWNLDLSKALQGVPIVLVADGKEIARLVAKGSNKLAHSAGRGGHAT